MASDQDELVRRREAGRWLRSVRERRGFPTGDAPARRMGVTPGVISRYETGSSKISDERAEQIAEALEIDIITVRRNLNLWVPDQESEESEPLAEDQFERLDRLYEEWKRDSQRGPVLKEILESWGDRKTG